MEKIMELRMFAMIEACYNYMVMKFNQTCAFLSLTCWCPFHWWSLSLVVAFILSEVALASDP